MDMCVPAGSKLKCDMEVLESLMTTLSQESRKCPDPLLSNSSLKYSINLPDFSQSPVGLWVDKGLCMPS